MLDIIQYIVARRAQLASVPFVTFLEDDELTPAERLSCAFGVAPVAMAFRDLNRSVVHRDPPEDALQELINEHAREDSRHWSWYLSDLRRLGLRQDMSVADAMSLLMADGLSGARAVCPLLTHLLLSQQRSEQRLAIILAIEATGMVVFRAFSRIAQKVEAAGGPRLLYFGHTHLDAETGDLIIEGSYRPLVQQIVLSPEEQAHCRAMVDQVFAAFERFLQELLVFARSGALSVTLPEPPSAQGHLSP